MLDVHPQTLVRTCLWEFHITHKSLLLGHDALVEHEL